MIIKKIIIKNSLLKYCTKCKTFRGIEEFNKQHTAKDGRRPHCKKCRKIETKRYRSKNREELNKKKREHHRNNRDEIRQKKKEYYLRNKDYVLTKVKQYYKNNKEKIQQYQKKYRELNADKLRESSKEYRIKRKREDPEFKLRINLRKRLREALKSNQKTGSAIEDLGCSIEYLKQYLESQFQSGMSWNNWGTGSNCWHIDHIQPLSKFDLTDPEQVKKACHYTNLQPLWAKDNMSKSNKDDRRFNNMEAGTS